MQSLSLSSALSEQSSSLQPASRGGASCRLLHTHVSRFVQPGRCHQTSPLRPCSLALPGSQAHISRSECRSLFETPHTAWHQGSRVQPVSVRPPFSAWRTHWGPSPCAVPTAANLWPREMPRAKVAKRSWAARAQSVSYRSEPCMPVLALRRRCRLLWIVCPTAFSLLPSAPSAVVP
jgi:hypothetical protein